MGITKEQLTQIEIFGIKKHLQIVDGYIASGLELDDLTIHYGIDQESCAIILHGYNFGLGSSFHDSFDSIRKYKAFPFSWIDQYVSTYYPGLLNENVDEIEINFESFLENYQPNWRAIAGASKRKMFGLSKHEQESNSK